MSSQQWTKAGMVATAVLVLGGGLSDIHNSASKDKMSSHNSNPVTNAMNQMADKEVRLIRVTEECLDPHVPNSCLPAYQTAVKNTGESVFSGFYPAEKYNNSLHLAFRACARNHGWADCKMDAAKETVYTTQEPDIVVPADESNVAKAQFVWMLPGYQRIKVGLATDGRKYELKLP